MRRTSIALSIIASLLPGAVVAEERSSTKRLSYLSQAYRPAHLELRDRTELYGTPYLEMRKRMLADGFAAGPTPPNSLGCGIGWEDICKKYEETVVCRAGSKPGCEFMFWKGKRIFRVDTKGEDIEDQRVTAGGFVTERQIRAWVGE